MKFSKIAFTLSFLIILGFQSLNAQDASTLETSTEQTAELNIQKMELKVKGVGCSTDVKTIAASVEKLEGVSSCKNLKKGSLTIYEVQYNPSQVTAAAIRAHVENTPGCKNPDARPYKVKI